MGGALSKNSYDYANDYRAIVGSQNKWVEENNRPVLKKIEHP
jgi:serine protease inhibitor